MTDEQLQDLFAGMQHHLDKSVDAIEQRLNALDAKIEILDAKIEKVETTLLAEFHKWASPAESRIRTHTIFLRTIDLDFEYLQQRLAKREGEKPPQ